MAITPQKALQALTGCFCWMRTCPSVEASTGNIFFHDCDGDEREQEGECPHVINLYLEGIAIIIKLLQGYCCARVFLVAR